MRRRLAARLVVRQRIGNLFAKAGDFAAQPVKLRPLAGHRLIEVFNGLVLKSDAGFELFDFFFELSELGHGENFLVGWMNFGAIKKASLQDSDLKAMCSSPIVRLLAGKDPTEV